MIRQNLGSVLLFELLCRGVGVPVYLRFADRGIRLALHMTGDSYLTAGNLARFLSRPGTLAVFLVLAAVGVLFLLFETAGLITAFQGSACDQKLTLFSVLAGALEKLRGGMSRGIWRLAVPTLAGGVWLHLFLLVRVFTHVRPVNFVLMEIADSPALSLGAAGVLLVGLALVLPLAFLHFEYLAGRHTSRESRAKSRRRMKAHGPQVLLSLTAGVLAAAAGTAAVYLAGVFAAAVFVTLFVPGRLALAVMFLAAERIEQVALLGGSMGVNVLCLGILAVFYSRDGSEPGENPIQPAHGSGPEKHRRLSGGRASMDSRSRRRVTRFFCLTVLMLAVYLADLARNRFPISGELMEDIQITAHRGGSRRAPENTLAALLAAEEDMADYAEIDVQLTADGVVVLAHDRSLKRVAGISRTVASLEWAELSRLDVGSWFSPAYAGERIPTLEEVLEFSEGRLRLNIELKQTGGDRVLAGKVAELVRSYGYEEQCVITSTRLEDLVQVKQAAPELKTGYVIPAAYGDYYSMEAVDFISIRQSFVNQALVEKLHSQGKEVHVWTVNQPKDMERLRLLGVDNLITDDPVLARETLYREETAETVLEYLGMVFESCC
ncbi:MAG: glycerophosphodiester phosphodiesterase [Lachnospiraceae bacterium]|nr:glycerophosphodiester phosphodiesterase [Lachnospiraceae bacterium]